jgi:hypothetical protein
VPKTCNPCGICAESAWTGLGQNTVKIVFHSVTPFHADPHGIRAESVQNTWGRVKTSCHWSSIPCRPTCDPPHRQWLVRAGVGGAPFVVVIVPPLLDVCCSPYPLLFIVCHCLSLFVVPPIVCCPPVICCPPLFVVPPLSIVHCCSHPLVHRSSPALSCRPTCEPPHEQLLIGVGVGAVLSVVGGCCSRSLLSSRIRVGHYQ